MQIIEVTYTLIYQNTGNSTANNVLVTDVLDSKLVYVVDSAKLMGVDQKMRMILLSITISLLVMF